MIVLDLILAPQALYLVILIQATSDNNSITFKSTSSTHRAPDIRHDLRLLIKHSFMVKKGS